MQSKVKAVIFDYGGVLCKLPTTEQIQELASLCDLDEADFLKHFWTFRLAYDRGDLDGLRFWRSIAKAAGKSYTDEQIQLFVEKDVHVWLQLDEPMLAWNRTLREGGWKTAILSNMPDALGIHLRQHSTLFDQFDHITLSYEIRSAKPESKIYRSCMAHLGLKSGDAVFLDDKVVNTRAAQAVGLHAITFKSREDFVGREDAYSLPPIPLD